DDARVAELAPLCDGSVIFFATSARAPVLVAHREAGGRCVYLDGNSVVLAETTETSVPLSDAPCSETELRSLLAAVAAAWALGIGADLMRAGIESFMQPTERVP